MRKVEPGSIAEPAAPGFTCTELVAATVARVRCEEQGCENGAEVLSKTRRENRRKRKRTQGRHGSIKSFGSWVNA